MFLYFLTKSCTCNIQKKKMLHFFQNSLELQLKKKISCNIKISNRSPSFIHLKSNQNACSIEASLALVITSIIKSRTTSISAYLTANIHVSLTRKDRERIKNWSNKSLVRRNDETKAIRYKSQKQQRLHTRELASRITLCFSAS